MSVLLYKKTLCTQAVIKLHPFGPRLASIALLALLDQLNDCLQHREN